MPLYHPIELGNIRLNGNLFLAPMAGYTDKTFRSICLSHGANLTYTEMISAEGLARDSKATKILAERADNEKILALQLFGPAETVFMRCIENLMLLKPQLIDLNCGCPVLKVVKTGAGSAMMKTPREIGKTVKTLVQETGLPVTVKIRAGWDSKTLNYLECAQQAFNNGAAAVCMHARTKAQLYMPYAHYEYLKDLKEHFPEKTVIGSGDLFSEQDAFNMLQYTKADAVAFARGAIGNPFIFEQTKAFLENKKVPVITAQQKIAALLDHLKKLAQEIGEQKACREMRKHVGFYLKAIPFSSQVKNKLCRANTVSEYEKIICVDDA